MSYRDKIRKPNTRARRQHGHLSHLVRIGRVTVSADELLSWQLGPVINRREQRAAMRAERS